MIFLGTIIFTIVILVGMVFWAEKKGIVDLEDRKFRDKTENKLDFLDRRVTEAFTRISQLECKHINTDYICLASRSDDNKKIYRQICSRCGKIIGEVLVDYNKIEEALFGGKKKRG